MVKQFSNIPVEVIGKPAARAIFLADADVGAPRVMPAPF
jgi:hypothetical protein